MTIFWQSFFQAFSPVDDVFLYMWLIALLFIYNIYLVISKDQIKSEIVLKFSLIIGVFGTLFGLILTGDACAGHGIPADKILQFAMAGFSASLMPLIFHFLCWLLLSIIALFIKKE